MAWLGRPVKLVIWEKWLAEERCGCAACWQLRGTLHRYGEGPRPPLHEGCLCERRVDHIEIVKEVSA